MDSWKIKSQCELCLSPLPFTVEHYENYGNYCHCCTSLCTFPPGDKTGKRVKATLAIRRMRVINLSKFGDAPKSFIYDKVEEGSRVNAGELK